MLLLLCALMRAYSSTACNPKFDKSLYSHWKRHYNLMTKPELAEMNYIEYLLKRREDTQGVAKQILDRIEQRINIKVVA